MSEFPELAGLVGDSKESRRYLASFVLAEAIRQSEREEDKVDEIRRRSVGITGASAVALTVVGSIGIDAFGNAEKWLFLFGIGALVLAVVLVGRIQMPVKQWASGLSPSSILGSKDRWLEHTEAEIQEIVAAYLSKGYQFNNDELRRLGRYLRWSVLLEGLMFVLLVAAVVMSLF